MRTFKYRESPGESHVDLIQDGEVVLTVDFPTPSAAKMFHKESFDYMCEQNGVDKITEEEIAAYETWILTQVD
jgi:hypothetical protein